MPETIFEPWTEERVLAEAAIMKSRGRLLGRRVYPFLHFIELPSHASRAKMDLGGKPRWTVDIFRADWAGTLEVNLEEFVAFLNEHRLRRFAE